MDENKDMLESTEASPVAQPVTEDTAEKETTVELRESYEEVAAENGDAKKPQKKKMKRWKLTVIIVACIIGAILLAGGLFLLITTLMNKKIDAGSLTFENNAKPAYASMIDGTLQAKIDVAMAPGATDEQKSQAVAALYALANQNKINTDKCVMIAQGQGTATVADAAEGEMSVRGFFVQDNGAFYFQKGAKLTDVNVGDTEMLSNMLDQQERTFYAGTGSDYYSVYLKGSMAGVSTIEEGKFDPMIPFLILDAKDADGNIREEYKTKYTKAEYMKASYTVTDPKEINHFDYIAEAMKDASIKHNSKGYYELDFALDIPLDDDGEVDTKDPKYTPYSECVRLSRKYLRDSSNSDDLEFTMYELHVEIWDNGYIKQIKEEEKWEGIASVRIFGIDIPGQSASESWYECAFYYDYDSLVEDGFLDEDDETISEANFCRDLINKYAAIPEWVK